MLTEVGTRRLVARICKDMGVDPPAIKSSDKKPHAHFHSATNTIYLPSPSWVKRNSAASSTEYRLLILHELAHYLSGGLGHTSIFYVVLFGLCRKYGVPLAFAFEDEIDYKKRAAMAGMNKYLAVIERSA